MHLAEAALPVIVVLELRSGKAGDWAHPARAHLVSRRNPLAGNVRWCDRVGNSHTTVEHLRVGANVVLVGPVLRAKVEVDVGLGELVRLRVVEKGLLGA